MKRERIYARAIKTTRLVFIGDGLEGNIEHGGIPALLKKVTRRVLVTCKAYYSSVPVNRKLKTYVNFVDLSGHLHCSAYANS